MKTRAFVTATLFVLSIIAAAQVAQADEPMTVNIPFAFVAGNATLPAGEYRVQKLDGNPAVVLIRCSGASAAAMVMSNAAQAKETQTQSKLVFNRYGNRYFLSQVWAAGSIRGRQLLKSSREKEISQPPNPNGKPADRKPEPSAPASPFLLTPVALFFESARKESSLVSFILPA